VAWRRRALPHDLLGFVDLEPRLLQVLYHPRGELLARIIGNVILEKPAQKIAASGNREIYRECQLVAEVAMVHPPDVPISFSSPM
jgi:hypothetical protein